MNVENSHNYRSTSQNDSETNQIEPQECDEIRPAVPAHAIGATDPEEMAAIDALLARCPNTAAELATYRRMAERLLYSAPAAEAPPQLRERLRAAIPKPSSASAAVPPLAANYSGAGGNGVRSQSPLLRRRAVSPRPLRNAFHTVAATDTTPARPPRTLPFGARTASSTRRRGMPTSSVRGPAIPQLPAAMAMYRLQPDQTQIHIAKATAQPIPSSISTLRNPWHFGRFLATAAVLALVFINLALLTQNQQLQLEQQQVAHYLAQQSQALILLAAEEPKEIEIFAPDGESRAKADILWNEDLGIAVVYVRDFPQCDPGMKYQLWLTKDGQRRSGGLFSVDSSGMGLLVMPLQQSIDLYDSIGITPEPEGGSPGPTAPPVVRSEL